MPTVSTGGTPLAVIAPSAAAISRHTTPEDARFAALLPPIAAELIKGGSKSAQSETAVAQCGSQVGDNQLTESASPNQPRTAGDGTKAQPTQAALSLNKASEAGDPSVPAPATTHKNLIPTPIGSGMSRLPGAVRTAPKPVDPETAPAAGTPGVVAIADRAREQNGSGSALTGTIKDAAPVTDEATPQSDSLLATQPLGGGKADEQNLAITSRTTSVGTVAVVEPLVKSAAAAVKQPGVANPSETASPVVSATSEMAAEVSTGMPTSAIPQAAPNKAARETAAAKVTEVTTSKHASVVPQLAATHSLPATSSAAAAGAHVAAKSQSDTANSSPLALAGAVAAMPPDAHVIALAQSGAAILPSTTAAATARHASAIPQSDAGNSSAITSVGTVTAMTADTSAATLSPLDPTNPQPPPVPTLPVGNGITAASTLQSQPHDARSDPVAPPLYIAGVAASAAPSDATIAPPSGLPATVPPETATQQVAMHVAQSLNDGGKTITVELHPAELGRVEIHFSFHSDGTNVRLTVDRPETFDAFSHDRGGLQQQLAQAGVDLGGGGLDLRLGQQQPEQSGSYSSGRTPRITMPTPQPDAAPATLWVSNSLLDILA